MSWIYGYIGNSHQLIIDPPETPIYQFKNSNLILFAGGNKQTCFFRLESSNSFWTVVGVGLKSTGGGYKILDENDWASHLFPNQNIKTVNGHLVALLYSESELKIFTDDLGLREIYIVKLSDGYGFTTRIEWLKFFIKPEIDLKEFGARWLLQNQISRKSIIKNVIRLVGANGTIKHNSLSVEQNFWKPNFGINSNRKAFDLTLKKLLSIQDKRISLSLSGGLDSRLLLSYLALKNSDLWDTHTFGDPNHPDSVVASKLMKSLSLENELIDDELPSVDELINLVKTYSVQSIVTNPISSVLNLRFYKNLSGEKNIIVDGGFGEIWRRTFANRLLLFGKNALEKKNAKETAKFLRYYRADIFLEEALIDMEKGIVDQFDNLFDEMPDLTSIRPPKWIDLFSIHSRLPNYYAPEQTRVDLYVISIMPLVQKDIINLIFSINDSDKANGKLFKQLIKFNAPRLTKNPLVKGNIMHSFNSSSISARLKSKIKNRMGLYYQSNYQIILFKSLKEFVGDTFSSAEVRNYDYYDSSKIDFVLNSFLSRQSSYNSELDWLLSFELFRQGISKD
jgi:hypothetical protein